MRVGRELLIGTAVGEDAFQAIIATPARTLLLRRPLSIE